MSARLREQHVEGRYRAEIAAPEWLARRSPREQVAAAAGLEPGLALVRARPLAASAPSGTEALRIRTEPWTTDGADAHGPRIARMRDRLVCCAERGALRAAPLSREPGPGAREALAAVCAELEGDPSSGGRDLDPALRGFPIYPRDDGSFRVALDARPGMPFVALYAAEGGCCALEVELASLDAAAPECADAAALAALRGAGSACGVGAVARNDGMRLVLAASVDAPIDATSVGLALCALEHAAIGCAREVARLVAHPDLARRYLAATTDATPCPEPSAAVARVSGEA